MPRSRSSFTPALISLAVASCFNGTALANPTGANVVRGTAAIHQAGNLLQITNSPNAIINWQSFSIGANEITRFLQQSPSSAVLNRVTTQNPSQILGSLQSKLLDGVTTGGRVLLINPNGILFGAGAQIDVGGLVASTLRMSDDDFLAGRMRFGDGLGKSVVNDGSIATGAGGSVYLIGSGITNNGIIRSPQGEVILAAGNSVELVNPGTPNLRVEIAALDNEARNLGQIISDAGRIGIYAGLINNSGTIRADSAVSEGGRIVLKATKSTTLEDTSVLSAQGQGGGEILVLADDTVRVGGRLDASAPNGGDGGFIETSGRKVTFDSSHEITTAAPYGRTGTWLIDPADFTIGSGGDITGAELGRNLDSNNVVITSDTGLVAPLGNGDIFVNEFVTWTASNSLTLLARRNVTINSSISGGGDLAFFAGWDGNSTSSPFVTNGVGNITSNFDSIATKGNVRFEAGQDILLGASSVTAGSGALDGLSKTAQLTAGRNISLTDPDGGASVLANGNNGSSAAVVLRATTGNITMEGSDVQATGGGITSVNGGSAAVTLVAGGGINLMNNSTVSAIGAGGISGGSGTATLFAGTGITISGSTVSASGGGGSSGAGGNALATLSTGGDITLASNVVANGGTGRTGNGIARIDLIFQNSSSDFVVNLQRGLIFDTTTGSGFLVDGEPAILNVNLFVTKGAPVFVDNLVASMNQQADVLADQLKAGDTGDAEDKDKKKLPFCSG